MLNEKLIRLVSDTGKILGLKKTASENLIQIPNVFLFG